MRVVSEWMLRELWDLGLSRTWQKYARKWTANFEKFKLECLDFGCVTVEG